MIGVGSTDSKIQLKSSNSFKIEDCIKEFWNKERKTDYNWENWKKNKSTKENFLAKLPEYLIIHLIRFEGKYTFNDDEFSYLREQEKSFYRGNYEPKK